MYVNLVADPAETSRNLKRFIFADERYSAKQCFIENGVNSFLIVGTAFGQAGDGCFFGSGKF
jgi:hypothetical protein